MIQISEKILLDEYIYNLDIQTNYLPSPYKETPYLIIKNFLEPHELSLFVKEVNEDEDAEQAKVKSEVIHGVVEPKVIKKYRDTNIYSLDTHLNELYQSKFLKHQKIIEEYFHIALTTSTDVQALEYIKDGFYIQHADDSNALIDKDGNIVGYTTVAPERKLTTVLFATSYKEDANDRFNFSGGELVFNFLRNLDGSEVILKPEAGDMVVFPSNPYFSHEVKKVKSGYRLTLVQWHNAILN
ncbi:2OG-Fe(II) oxygenase [Sulfurimonas sp.]|uniref:2OG-Fe(II) oxygenase n=1 Tax=Sulfurimonas sp. TaxID=2022749 RepID=UPI0035629E0D